jgi:hypothetical protein
LRGSIEVAVVQAACGVTPLWRVQVQVQVLELRRLQEEMAAQEGELRGLREAYRRQLDAAQRQQEAAQEQVAVLQRQAADLRTALQVCLPEGTAPCAVQPSAVMCCDARGVRALGGSNPCPGHLL